MVMALVLCACERGLVESWVDSEVYDNLQDGWCSNEPFGTYGVAPTFARASTCRIIIYGARQSF